MTRKINSLQPAEAGRSTLRLLVEVEFGVPSRQCVNYGICRIEIARARGRPKNSGCRQCGGLALASVPEPGQLELAFLPASLSEKTRQQHFGQGHFLVEEAYPLPWLLHSSLGLPPVAIDSGRYAITESEKHLAVRFFNLIMTH